MINPFDLRGPSFLLFYFVLGVALNLLLHYLIVSREKESPAAMYVCSDAYKLASLRGGAAETLRIVLFSLIDRGLLKDLGASVMAEPHAGDFVKKPVEQAVVSYLATPREVPQVLTDASCLDAAGSYCRELAGQGLMADEAVLQKRKNLALGVLLLLVGISAMKIVIAFSRGRHNVIFLVILTLVFSAWCIGTSRRPRTGAGDEVLRRARARFSNLKGRAAMIRPGGMTNEASLIAALFGLSVLPTAYFPYLSTLFPQPASTGDSSYSSDSSSSGCGGGGCGGGGCGGCGS